jgi:hypothetical protein
MQPRNWRALVKEAAGFYQNMREDQPALKRMRLDEGPRLAPGDKSEIGFTASGCYARQNDALRRGQFDQHSAACFCRYRLNFTQQHIARRDRARLFRRQQHLIGAQPQRLAPANGAQVPRRHGDAGIAIVQQPAKFRLTADIWRTVRKPRPVPRAAPPDAMPASQHHRYRGSRPSSAICRSRAWRAEPG